MQATVFDFTFRLRERNREIYITRSSGVVMSQGFKMIWVGNHPKNFSMRSAIGSSGATQEKANEIFEKDGTPYNRALFFGDGLFSLSKEEGFNYTPTVLLRRSVYHGVIIGRMISRRGFLTSDRMFIVRRSVLPLSINPSHEVRLIQHKNRFPLRIIGTDPHKTSIWRSSNPLRIKADGELLTLKRSIYPRMIEGKTRKVLFFSEKISFGSYRFGDVSYMYTPSARDFSGIRFSKSIFLTVSGSIADFNGLKRKYAIISLEKNLIKTRALRSKPSRLTIKG